MLNADDASSRKTTIEQPVEQQDMEELSNPAKCKASDDANWVILSKDRAAPDVAPNHVQRAYAQQLVDPEEVLI